MFKNALWLELYSAEIQEMLTRFKTFASNNAYYTNQEDVDMIHISNKIRFSNA